MTTLTREETTLQSADRTPIFLRHWPHPSPKAVLIVCHGLGEHGDRYDMVVERFGAQGFAIFAPDHRGHGKSGGQRGHADRFDRFIADIFLVVKRARETYPGKKVFLYGHSLGGLIVLTYALKHPETISGVISSGAALKLSLDVPKVKATAGRLMASIWPTLSLGNELDPLSLTHDEEVVRAYVNDPLVHDRVTTRFFVEFTAAMGRTLTGAPAFTPPLLMVHGGEDGLTSPDGTKEFFAKAGSKDKTLRIFEGNRHEIHNDSGQAELLALMDEWLGKHLID